jgi:predicted O-methyltransferase YrrM
MEGNAPELVRRAADLAHRLGFPLHRGAGGGASCCRPDVGRLLGVLAARSDRIGEIGTGVGYGTAWMASAMPSTARLVTIEIDAGRAAAAAELFSHDERVRVINGDASGLISEHAPFDLLFADGAGYGRDEAQLRSLFPLLAIGGTIVVDDVTPLGALPADSPFRQHDAKREAFAADSSVWSVEVVAPDLRNSALVATRVR